MNQNLLKVTYIMTFCEICWENNNYSMVFLESNFGNDVLTVNILREFGTSHWQVTDYAFAKGLLNFRTSFVTPTVNERIISALRLH